MSILVFTAILVIAAIAAVVNYLYVRSLRRERDQLVAAIDEAHIGYRKQLDGLMGNLLDEQESNAQSRAKADHYRARYLAADRANIQLGRELAEAESENAQDREEVLSLKSLLADAELRLARVKEELNRQPSESDAEIPF